MTSFSAYTAFIALRAHPRSGGNSVSSLDTIWCMLVELEAGPNPGLEKVLMRIKGRPFNPELCDDSLHSRLDCAIQQEISSPAWYNPVATEQTYGSGCEKDLAQIIEFVSLWRADGNGFSTWMHDALGMMAKNHMLYDTFRAIAKLLFGESTKNQEMANLGQQLYVGVLRSVSFELANLTPNTKIDLLIIVVVLAMLEVSQVFISLCLQII